MLPDDAATTSENVLLTVLLAASTTFTVTLSVSAVPGVPLSTPVLELIESHDPVSGVSDVMLQVYGVVPLAATTVVEYADPTVAPGSGDPVVIAKDDPAAVVRFTTFDAATYCAAGLTASTHVQYSVDAVAPLQI